MEEGKNNGAASVDAVWPPIDETSLTPNVFYAAVEQAPAAISITDAQAHILYVNPTFERVTGYRREEVIGRNESVLSDKVTPREVYQTMWQRLLSCQSWSGVLVNRRKDGTRYLAELMIAPVMDAKGDVRRYLGIHRDITDMHRLERQVANQKHQFESLVEAAPVSICLRDGQGHVVMANGDYRALAEDMGMEPVKAFTAGTISETSGFRDREVEFPLPDGTSRWFVASGTWIEELDESAGGFFAGGGSRRRLLVVAKEVTRLKQQDAAIRHNTLRALVAEEAMVHGMREAVSAAAFQLQGPMNLLKAALGMLERRGGEGDPRGVLTGVIVQALASGQQALETLRAALPEARREPATRLNVNQLLREVLSLATERMLAMGVQVEWRPDSHLPPLLGFENRLRAVLKQLIDNALDAMDGAAVRQRDLRLITQSAPGAIRITLEDTGTGVPEALRLRIFEPFFTTKENAGRMGMGLPMVQEVINQHGGTVHLESGPQGGCTVNLLLPVGSSAVVKGAA
jgi:nitrogen fixation negative regulator NifL